MRNLLLLQDSTVSRLFDDCEEVASDIVSICRDIGSSSIYALSTSGCLSSLDISNSLTIEDQLSLLNGNGERDNTWFDATFIGEIGAVVCVSHSGTIVSVREDPMTGRRCKTSEQEGDVDGGIAAASWNPDTSSLVIVTNNDSVLLMTAYWDVLEEITLPARLPGSACSISWRGDGEYFTILTVDKDLSIPQARVYTKKLELISLGRNVADGPASVLKGLGNVVSYATNGSLIALSQQQGKGKLQIVFLEKNGLRHLEFPVQCPPVPEGSSEWVISSLHWDLPSTLLAVGLMRSHNGEVEGVVQLYYRGNYHWYLKQQWAAPGLHCLGFDTEIVCRIFMVQNSMKNATSGKIARDALRVADFAWDVTVSGTADGSIAVTDGCSLLLTPLSLNTVPPPMSIYKHQLTSPCIHSFFWPVPVSGGAGWGLACLSGENRVTLVFADEKGMPQRQANVDVPSVICSIQAVEERSHELSTPWVARPFNMRGIAATQPINVVGDGGEVEGGIVYVLLYGSRETIGCQQRSPVVRDEGVPSSSLAPDQIIILVVRALDGSVLSSSHISLLTVSYHFAEDPCRAAAVSRVSLWPGDPASLAVSLVADQNTFEVHRMNVTHQAGDLLEGMELKSLNCTSKLLPQLADVTGTQCDPLKGAVQSPPEHCIQIAVIPASSSAGSAADSTQYASFLQENNVVIGLTSKGKLYCGETLLVAGVSSFALNYPLEVLLYISTGTRPLLHFCSFTSLRSLDPLKGEAWEDQQMAAAMLGAEPRPVERGARLVLAAPGSPKVVLQMPRGNLEGFEPRPLIFLKARELLDKSEILPCLLLLRRQKVDLNYLIDYNPVLFLGCVVPLVRDILALNPDLLSLLVSSLEPGDTTAFKYPTHAPVSTVAEFITWRASQLPEKDFYEGGSKVNIVCSAVRDALLKYLDHSQGDKVNTALYPALCTYAKQNPPMLVEALTLIKAVTSSGEAGQLLPASRAPAAIKYLALLAEGSALFDAALGCCDFDMARAVARQCQMDPKAYLPLLKEFEDLGISTDSLGPGFSKSDSLEGAAALPNSWEKAHMHFAVCVHLKRFEEAIEWSMKVFKEMWLVNLNRMSSEADRERFLSIMEESYRIIAGKVTSYFPFALPLTVKLLGEIVELEKDVLRGGGAAGSAGAGAGAQWVVTAIKGFLSRTRGSYGDYCLKKLQFSEAVSAYLSASPPRAEDAVKAARLLGDWQLALMIAGRYGSSNRGQGGSTTNSEAETGAVVNNADLDPKRVAFEIVSAFKESLEQGESGIFEDAADADLNPLGIGEEEKGKALEAAQMSVSYCDDAETAVSILLLASKWTAAAQLALKVNRRDLFFDEIAPAIRSAAANMISALPKRSERQAALVTELSVLWADPNVRLKQVASTEPTLVAELNGGHINPDGTVWKDKEGDDTKSEFSIVSRQSGASYISSASRSSVRSSASSSVSILSSISVGSTGGRSAASTSTFCIDGLDHSLLSRGTAKGIGGSDLEGKAEAPRKYKRRQRKSCKGEGGRDLWGLRREAAVCAELWSLAQVSSIANSAKDLCGALSLFALGGAGDIALACALQASVDRYVKELQSRPPPVAPMYPPEWMGVRQLAVVCRYQEIMFPSINLSSLEAANTEAEVPDDGNESTNEKGNDDELIVLARQKHFNIVQERNQSSGIETWWKTAADGILLWQSYRRIVLES